MVGSVTPLFGEGSLGLTVLPDGTLLRDALSADPVTWLGPSHASRWGADPALLVKLLEITQLTDSFTFEPVDDQPR